MASYMLRRSIIGASSRSVRMAVDFGLQGQVAVVTGSTSGIGYALADALAAQGVNIVMNGLGEMTAIERARAEMAEAHGVEVLYHGADMTKPDQIADMVAYAARELGRLDILVNNAGINIRKAPQDYSVEEWHEVMDTNLTSAFVASQAAYPHLKQAGRGKVVNIGSMMSIFGGGYLSPYSASKGAIVQLTRSLAAAWARDNIQVNAVLPGWIDTALTRKARVELKGLEERVLSRTPAGRWGEPGDLAGIAVFLCSPASDFVTGTAIPVDGGYSSQA
jgi:2-deoxy-D-gluconate 3-dehydrogenase